MSNVDLRRSARREFSVMGLALCVVFAVSFGAQLLWFGVPALIPGLQGLLEKNYWTWLGVGIPMYVLAMPLGALILWLVPAAPPEKNPFSVGKFLIFVPVAFFITYAGNIIGTMLSLVLSDGLAENPINDLAMENSFWKVLTMVILAPVMEELLFRKLLIDRAVRYGEKTAVLLSAITFGLFHQNLFQFFYAFGAGLLLAYLYVRSGKLRYPIILHMIINFMGSVVAPAILTLLDQEKLTQMQSLPPEEMVQALMEVLPQMLVVMLYGLTLLGLSIAGLVLLIVFVRKLQWKEVPGQLPLENKFKTVYLNFGMILFAVLCLVMFVVALL